MTGTQWVCIVWDMKTTTANSKTIDVTFVLGGAIFRVVRFVDRTSETGYDVFDVSGRRVLSGFVGTDGRIRLFPEHSAVVDGAFIPDAAAVLTAAERTIKAA